MIPYILHSIFVFLHVRRIKDNYSHLRKPLRDLIFDNSIDLRGWEMLTNILPIIFIIPYFQKNGFNAFIFFIKFFSIIIAIRTISSTITDIPSSNPKCSTIKENLSWKNYISGHCFDKIFSGHTAATLLLIMIARKYNLLSINKTIILIFLQILFVYFFLICTRGHYSVDVFLSYVIVIPLFSSLQDEI
jgi:hypothetical protein